jgi:hypothetical protein
VLWRISGIETSENSRAMFELRKKIIGHVLGRTANEEIAGALTIIQELEYAIKIPLDIANKRYMTVNKPAVDYRVNAITAGQITVTLSRFTNRPSEEVPLMQHVYNTGNIN